MYSIVDDTKDCQWLDWNWVSSLLGDWKIKDLLAIWDSS